MVFYKVLLPVRHIRPPPNLTLQKSTQTFPAFTEAALEAEGQTGSKGS